MRILVLGYLVRGPLGGLAWHHLHYVLGLRGLGHEVYFLEVGDNYDCCYHPEWQTMTHDPSFGLSFANAAFSRLGLGECWAYHDAHTSTWRGGYRGPIEELCRSADLLLNVSGVNALLDAFLQVPIRVLIDTDPVFTQIRHLTDSAAMEIASKHNAFFSFGENLGLPGCLIPSDGFGWRTTRQPIVLDAWASTPGPVEGNYSTVIQWDSYPAREYGGRTYGMKSASFPPYFDLPRKVDSPLELAIGSPSAPRALLRDQGWIVSDPYEATRDPWVYQQFIQKSKGEFTVAKHGYVVTHSGWFSERSACYLAAGRPVITQDTGFGTVLPTGEGLFAFNTMEEILAAFEAVESDYERHSRAAREIAEEYFRAEKVLGKLLNDLGI
jgi:hypothetical protein